MAGLAVDNFGMGLIMREEDVLGILQ